MRSDNSPLLEAVERHRANNEIFQTRISSARRQQRRDSHSLDELAGGPTCCHPPAVTPSRLNSRAAAKVCRNPSSLTFHKVKVWAPGTPFSRREREPSHKPRDASHRLPTEHRKRIPPHGPRSILALWHAPRDKFRAQGSVRCESSAKVGVRRTCLSLRCPEVGEDSEVRATLDEVLPRAGFLGLSSSPRLRAARSFPGPVSSPTQVPRFQCCELYSRKVASFSSLRSPFHSPPAGKDLRQVPPRLVEQTPRVGAF